MTLRVDIELDENWRAYERLFDAKEFERLIWRTMTRASRDVSRLFVRHLKIQIRAATTRRTGRLLAVKTKVTRRRADALVRIAPDFPRTAYVSRRSRGQYAFVVNARRQFIERAVQNTQRDPQLRALLNKHFAFILDQYLKQRDGI